MRPSPIRILACTRRLHLNELEDRSVPAATFAVTTTADSGPGSLRQALLDANATSGADTITFDIPGAGSHTIQPLSALPTVTDAVLIDGWSEPDFAGTPVIELRGTTAGTAANGLSITGANSTVRGLVVNGFSGSGIELSGSGATGNVIRGNYLGTTVSGDAALGNGSYGVAVFGAADTTIGGSTAGEGNVVSGNSYSGMYLENSGLVRIQGNNVGTNAAGTAAVPNLAGIVFGFGGVGIQIGGPSAGARNVISGNKREGIYLEAGVQRDVVIQGNLIGTNSSGTAAIGNEGDGIRTTTEDRNILIGGTTAAERNVISGNGGNGIEAGSAGTTTITGNYIGTDVTGMVGLGNKGGGVSGFGTIGGLTVVPGTGAGNVISGNSFGILVSNAAVRGNIVGLGADGVTVIANGAGIIATSASAIGGTDARARNVVSGNRGWGMEIYVGVTVQGNYVGTDITGTLDRGNAGGGIFGPSYGVPTGATIGGAVAGAGNLISGNGGHGIVMGARDPAELTGLVIQGNRIGTNASGTAALGNDEAGIFILGNVRAARIGGSGAGEGNLISGNGTSGIYVSSFEGVPDGTVIRGNRIGTTADGTAALGNGYNGIYINGARNTVVGGPSPGDGNLIRGNVANGVLVAGSTLGTVIRGNAISGNGRLGIDLGGDALGDGVTPNDAGDADAGANGLQNYPVVTSAQGGPTTTVQGTMSSTPGTAFTLDFYAGTTVDPSGYGEGGRYLGSAAVTTDASGSAMFSAPLLAASVVGEVITATATDDALRNTSEFSAVSTPVYNSPPTAHAGGPYTIAEGDSLGLDSSASADPDDDELTYSWDVNGDGTYGDASGVSPTLTWAQLNALGIVDGPATRNVRVQVSDGVADPVISAAVLLTVTNRAPTAFIDTIGSPRVEGTSITLTGLATDPAGTDDPLTYAWAVFKNGAATPVATGAGTDWAFTPDDNGSYRIALAVSDGDGVGTDTETIVVANVAPTAGMTGPTAGIQGHELSLGSTVSDPGTTDTHTYVWSVQKGGQPVHLTGVSRTGPTFSFIPTEAGTYVVTLILTDDDGGSGAVSRSIAVAAATGAVLLPDPCNPGQTMLLVGGTNGDDKILVNPGGGAPEIKVKINHDQSTFVGVSRIVIYANGGADDVQIAGGMGLPVMAFGGTGDDRLKSGGGNAVLLGEAGDDLLVGGNGRDVLIGGTGSDRMVGNAADDILIAGFTDYDGNGCVLLDVSKEWGRTDATFAVRVSHLTGEAGGSNGVVVLNDQTVHDDGDRDALTGNAGQDWFWYNADGDGNDSDEDEVMDLSTFEAMFDQDLDFINGP